MPIGGNAYDSGMRGREKKPAGLVVGVTMGVPRPPGSRDPIPQDPGGTGGDLTADQKDPLVVSGMRREAPNVARAQALTSDQANGVNDGGGRSLEEMAPGLQYMHDDEGNLVITVPKPLLGVKRPGVPPGMGMSNSNGSSNGNGNGQ